MHSTTALVLTAMVLAYAVVSAVVKRWYVAPALVFLLLGIVLGPNGVGLLEFGDDYEMFTVLAQLALTVILFNQASELDVLGTLRRGHLTVRLLVVGIPVTLLLGTATALVLLPVLPVWEAVCLAAIVAPTEVALIEALLDDARIPERVRHALSAETGFYDGFALAALLAALAVASDRADGDTAPAAKWVWFAVRTEFLSVGIGLVVGALGAWAILRSVRRGWMSDTWAQLATLAVALLCFQGGELVHASGFVAAFAGGLVFSVVAHRTREEVADHVTHAAAELLELLVFALLGAAVVVGVWREAGWRVIVFAVLALLAVRMVAVGLSLLGTDVPLRSRLFMGWFGPRGIGTVVLGLIVLRSGDIDHQDVIGQVVVVTVTLSLVVHSLTTPFGVRFVAPDRVGARGGPD
jgi:NhaP-type Na+/H+ or K+/H+ antiporter